jgi:hypothetical protein
MLLTALFQRSITPLLRHSVCSPDHFIRARQHVRRNCQADLLCSFQIDDELELGRLLDGQISGLCAFQNLVYIGCGAPVHVENISAIVHEAAGFRILRLWVNRRKPALYREFCNLSSMIEEDDARQRQDCVSTPLACGSECGLNILGT